MSELQLEAEQQHINIDIIVNTFQAHSARILLSLFYLGHHTQIIELVV